MDNNDDTLSTSTRASGFSVRPIVVNQTLRPGQQSLLVNQAMQVRAAMQSQSDNQSTILTLSDSNAEAIRNHENLMKAYEIQRKSKNLPIPTNDKEVKLRLREMEQPICLFGEDPGDRRERLRNVITKYSYNMNNLLKLINIDTNQKQLKNGRPPTFFQKFVDDQGGSSQAKDENDENEMFYTEGTEDLKKARLEIAKYSLPRAQVRLAESKRRRNEVDRLKEDQEIEDFLNSVQPYEVKESQYGDDRNVSRGALSPDEELFATSGWSGVCKIWGVPDCQLRTELKGHSDRVNCIKFHPFTGSIPEDGPNVATASADKTYEFQKSIELHGHEDTVHNIDFHPMGQHLASSSADKTWRLWDLTTRQDINPKTIYIYNHYIEKY